MKNPRDDGSIQELLEARSKANRNRNLILTFAVAVAIFVLFCAFSVAKGKIVVDAVKSLRENGSAASAYLKNAEKEQYEKLKNLDYINYVGQEHMVGEWEQKNAVLATYKVIDKTGYEKIIKPAYDGIVGHYPTNENEIMLSKRLLERLGIQNPQLGMKISAPIQFSSNVYVNDENMLTEELVLAGYYNDYIKESEYVPVVYLSEKYLEDKKIPVYPAKLLIVSKSDFLSNVQMEKQLYKDVSLTEGNQQFIGIDSVNYDAVNQFIGGYGIAVLCTIIVLLSAYFLIYNVLSMSVNKDIQYYGLLFTIGLTQKQVKKLMFRQNLSILIRGTAAGSILSLVAAAVIFPLLFRGLFLQQMGKIGVKTTLYPEILIGAVVIIVALMLLASKHAMKKLKKLSPIEAYRHREVTVSNDRRIKSKKEASIGRMARYNLFRSKGKLLITVISLFLGCQMALLTVFIANGTDTMNEVMQKPDFKMGTNKGAVDLYLWPYRSAEPFEVDRTKSLFGKTFMEKLLKVEELDKSSVDEVWGAYGTYGSSNNFLQPLLDTAHGTGTYNNFMTIQVVKEEYIQKLKSHAEKNGLNIDIDSVINGNGILVLHKHELSELYEEDAQEMTGVPTKVYSAEDEYGTGEGEEEKQRVGVDFVCAGYFDTTLKGFPQLEMSWNGDGIHYFLVGEKGFERLNLTKQVFGFTVNAKKGQEPSAKAQLTGLIREKNTEQKAVNVYYISSTSDEIAESQNYINNSRTVMFALCLSLFLLGITNYLNVMITNMVSRKKEFAIMESVGMTKKQLKRMLIMEGIYYWAILLATLVSIGSLMIWRVGVMIKTNLSYFRFVYPVKELIIMSVVLLFFCVLLPRVVYRKTSGESAVEQLRSNG